MHDYNPECITPEHRRAHFRTNCQAQKELFIFLRAQPRFMTPDWFRRLKPSSLRWKQPANQRVHRICGHIWSTRPRTECGAFLCGAMQNFIAFIARSSALPGWFLLLCDDVHQGCQNLQIFCIFFYLNSFQEQILSIHLSKFQLKLV